MIIKVHQAQGKQVTAICDEELLGKSFEENDLVLDLASDFYKGELVDGEETKKVMVLSDNLNLVGEKTIAIANELDLIDKDNIRTIKNIPYAQFAVTKS